MQRIQVWFHLNAKFMFICVLWFIFPHKTWKQILQHLHTLEYLTLHWQKNTIKLLGHSLLTGARERKCKKKKNCLKCENKKEKLRAPSCGDARRLESVLLHVYIQTISARHYWSDSRRAEPGQSLRGPNVHRTSASRFRLPARRQAALVQWVHHRACASTPPDPQCKLLCRHTDDTKLFCADFPGLSLSFYDLVSEAFILVLLSN